MTAARPELELPSTALPILHPLSYQPLNPTGTTELEHPHKGGGDFLQLPLLPSTLPRSCDPLPLHPLSKVLGSLPTGPLTAASGGFPRPAPAPSTFPLRSGPRMNLFARIMGTLASWMMVIVGFGGLLLLLVALIGTI